MKLSDGEKLILWMLSEIYDHLGIKSEIDPKFVRRAIHTGNAWGVKLEHSGIFMDEHSGADVQETADIMQMWSAIEASYKRLAAGEKARVERETGLISDHITFDGFDGNEESSHMDVAQFFVEQLDNFQEFKDRPLNSHRKTLDEYRPMLCAFHDCRNSVGARGLLSAEHLIQILNASRNTNE